LPKADSKHGQKGVYFSKYGTTIVKVAVYTKKSVAVYTKKPVFFCYQRGPVGLAHSRDGTEKIFTAVLIFLIKNEKLHVS